MENTDRRSMTAASMSSAAHKKRLYWIDIAKGLCMIEVILGHLGMPVFDFFYSFHLTVFFILSGYIMRTEPVTAKYLRQKFSRLMTPYFFTCAAMGAMHLVNRLLVEKNFSFV